MLDSRIIDPEQPEILPVNKRAPLDFETKYRALRKSGGVCPYCDAPLQFEHEYGVRVAYDHMIPISRGGADNLSNLIACCFPCNVAKHTKTALEYICELRGLQVHWFATFNPEMDGVSAEDRDFDLLDTAAWFAGWKEVCDGLDDSYSCEAWEEMEWRESEADFQSTLEDDLAILNEADND